MTRLRLVFSDFLRCSGSVITGKTLPDLPDPFLECVKPGMKALIVKVKDVADDYQPEKPVVTFQVAKNLLCRTGQEGNEPQQAIHLNQLPIRVAPEPLHTSYS
jgi:hypothetical protein